MLPCAPPEQSFLLKLMQKKTHSCVQALLLCWTITQGSALSHRTLSPAHPASFPHPFHLTNSRTAAAQVKASCKAQGEAMKAI